MRIINMLLAVMLVLFSSVVFAQTDTEYTSSDEQPIIMCKDMFAAREVQQVLEKNIPALSQAMQNSDKFKENCYYLAGGHKFYWIESNVPFGYSKIMVLGNDGQVYEEFVPNWSLADYFDWRKKQLSKR